jgi:hypothetical protein
VLLLDRHDCRLPWERLIVNAAETKSIGRENAAFFGRKLSLARNLGTTAAHAKGFACAFPPPQQIGPGGHPRAVRIFDIARNVRTQIYGDDVSKMERDNQDLRIARWMKRINAADSSIDLVYSAGAFQHLQTSRLLVCTSLRHSQSTTSDNRINLHRVSTQAIRALS